jgi:MarR family multiple antibiotic resistance transcriptional regulator
MASTSQPAPASASDLFDNLVRCETRLYNELNDRLREAHGIVTSQFESLRYIRDHEDARVADIAAYAAIGIGASSKGIDRLEKQGWVRRLPNPADRRSSLLELTKDGAALTADAQLTFTEVTEGLVAAALDPIQLAAAVSALAALRGALERDRVGVPVG